MRSRLWRMFVLVVLIAGCGNVATPRKANSYSNTDITSYATLESAFPVSPHGGAIITHDITYTNYAPVGWTVDPTDNTGFLLFVNKFMNDSTTGAKMSVYGGSLSDPYTVSFIGDILTAGAGGSWDADGIYQSASGVFYDNGIIRIAYNARSSSTSYMKVGVATSTDGRTANKFAGNPVLTPSAPFTGNHDGYFGPAYLVKDGVHYIYYNLIDNATVTLGIYMASSADGETWTDNQVLIVPNGAPGSSEEQTESAHAVPLGSDIAYLYSGYKVSPYAWSIHIARGANPYSQVTDKSASNPVFPPPNGVSHVACPILANPSPGKWVLYYQGQVNGKWDIYVADLVDPLDVPAPSSGILKGGTLRGGSLK